MAEMEGGNVQGHAPNLLQHADVAANNPLYADDNQLDVQEPAPNPLQPQDIDVAAANNVNDHLEDVQDHAPDLRPCPHVAEANVPIVNDDQLVERAVANGSLGMGVLDAGSVPSNIHEVHHELPRLRSRSAASNADAVSVCKVPTEETRLQQNPLQPVQEVGKRGDRVVHTGNCTEVRS